MSCEVVRLTDGSTFLVNVAPGKKLTERDKQALAEYAEFCRERAREKQRERNGKARR